MRISFALSSMAAFVACAGPTTSSPKGGPRGLRATEHLEVAQQQDSDARDDRTYAIDTSSTRDTPSPGWMRSWDPAAEHERLATLHRSKAAALQAAYEEACGSRSLGEVSISPLVRYGLSGWNTSTGVIMYLSTAAGPPEKLMADLKCHRAWMMISPAGMENCPLDLPGIQLDARGDDTTIMVTLAIRDPLLIDELQRRAAMELEKGAELRKGNAQ